MTNQIGSMMGMNGLEQGIKDIKNPYMRGAAHLGTGMFLDPTITALGAGANMGDRLYKEMAGTNKKAEFKRTQGLGGRLQNRGLING